MSKKEKEQKQKITARLDRLIDLVEENKKIEFLFDVDGGFVTIGEIKIGDEMFVPPSLEMLPFAPVKKSLVKSYEKAGDDWRKLFSDVQEYLRRFSHLTESQNLILAAYVFASYLQENDDLHYLPIISFPGVMERGKTRTGEATIFICYRGVRLVDLRDSNVFRHAERFNASLFFDLLDVWGKAVRNDGADVLLARYEKGAIISRVNPDKPAFEDQKNYRIFGPTIIASNSDLSRILESRTIPIEMENVPGRYEKPSPAKAEDLRARLAVFRLRHWRKPLPRVDFPDIVGRIWDIAYPLFAVCALVAPDRLEDMKTAITRSDYENRINRQFTIEGKIVKIALDLSVGPIEEGLIEWPITPGAIAVPLNEGWPDDKKISHDAIGGKLKAMGVKRGRNSALGRYYIFNREVCDKLALQYGFVDPYLHGTASQASQVSQEAPKETESMTPMTLMTGKPVGEISTAVDTFGAFMVRRCVLNAGNQVKADKFFRFYHAYCAETKVSPPLYNEFMEDVRSRFDTYAGTQGEVIIGIDLQSTVGSSPISVGGNKPTADFSPISPSAREDG